MPQPQAQQIPQYTPQFRQFDELAIALHQRHPAYAAEVRSLASTHGLQQAIDFCIGKLEAINTMQSVKDSEDRFVVQYEYSRYGSMGKTQCKNCEQAFDYALSDLETGEAWPLRILDSDMVVWEQSGVLNTRESLEKRQIKQ